MTGARLGLQKIFESIRHMLTRIAYPARTGYPVLGFVSAENSELVASLILTVRALTILVSQQFQLQNHACGCIICHRQ
jgi:hypothetical protein